MYVFIYFIVFLYVSYEQLTIEFSLKSGAMDWRCGTSSRSPLCKSKTLSSNPSPTKKKVKNCAIYNNIQILEMLRAK
jgi:hypothetical protein